MDVLVLVLVVIAVAVALARVISRDGYDHRSPPPSRHDWTNGTPWPRD